MLPSQTRARAAVALALCVPATSLGSALAYWIVPGTLGQALYMMLRLWIAVFPLLWVWRIERAPLAWSPVPRERSREAWVGALVLSVLSVAAIWGVWEWLGRGWLDVAQLRVAVARSGLDTPARYLAAAAYIAFANSLLEEYFWRWFVFRRTEELVGGARAVPLSAALFTAHHVLTFTAQFGLGPGLLASLGVFVAGCLWSACYLRWRSIWPGWITHVAADLAGLWLGWQLLFG